MMKEQFINSVDLGVRGQRTLPAAAYLDRRVFEAEQRQIFQNRWMCIGRTSEVPVPGSFRTMQIGNESLIAMRDTTGKLRVYFNLCRHRGTRLLTEPRGNRSKTIQCPYHAWTYDLQGNLIGVPDEKSMCNFDRREFGLHQVAVEEWEGFFWINLSTDPSPFELTFEQVLTKFTPWNLPSLVEFDRREYLVRANWKLIVQNYSECYHCAPVHPALVKWSSPTSGGNDLTEGDFLGGYMVIDRPGGSLTTSGRSCGATVGNLLPEDLQRVYYYVLFPNMFLSLHHDYVMVHLLWPIDVDQTKIECCWLVHPDSLNSNEWHPSEGVEFWDQTNREDWQVSELTQLGVASSRYIPGPYSDREAMTAAFDRTYIRAMKPSDSDDFLRSTTEAQRGSR